MEVSPWLAMNSRPNMVENHSGWSESTQSMDMNGTDRKSTRLNSSYLVISYAVFCLKKHRPGPVLGGHRYVCKRTGAGSHGGRGWRGRAQLLGAGCPAQPVFFFFLNERRPPDFSLFPHHDALAI